MSGTTTRGIETHEGEFVVSTDKSLLDVDLIHGFLAASYWSPGIPRVTVQRGIAGSVCFGVYHRPNGATKGRQVGFARLITDEATFAYLADVFIVEAFRGRGLGGLLMRTIMAHPELQGLRRFTLFTRDAHGLYEKFGFHACANPERFMEKRDPEGYKSHPRWAGVTRG